MFNNLLERIKSFFLANPKDRIMGSVLLVFLLVFFVYFGFIYKNSTYNVGLTNEQIKNFKQKEIELIEKEYQQKIAETSRDILSQKTQCWTTKSSGIIGDLEAKKRLATGEEEINKLNKEADAKIAEIQKACAKEYSPILKKALSTLEKEKNSKIWSVKINPVSITSEVEDIQASSGESVKAGSDGSVKTEVITSKEAQAIGSGQVRQNTTNVPNYQPVDFNDMPGQTGGGIPAY